MTCEGCKNLELTDDTVSGAGKMYWCKTAGLPVLIRVDPTGWHHVPPRPLYLCPGKEPITD